MIKAFCEFMARIWLGVVFAFVLAWLLRMVTL